MLHFVRVFLAALFLAVPLLGQESDLDTRLFRTINNTQNPDRDGFFEYLDHSSLPSFGAIPVGFVAVGTVTDNYTTVHAGIMSATAQAMAFGLTFAIKEIAARPRPFETLDDVKVKHLWSAYGRSFPSGHTSQAFAIATVLSLSYRNAAVTIPFFLWAGAIGYGRVYLGVHYPGDVLGGMAAGVLGGFAAWSLRKQIGQITRNIVPPDAALRSGVTGFPLVKLQLPF